MAKVYEFEGVEYEVPDDTTDEEFIEFIESEEAASRSKALGGPLPTQEERDREAYVAQQEAQKKLYLEQRAYPAFLPPPQPKPKPQGGQVYSPGGVGEGSYFTAREDPVPFLRPTRVEEIPRPAPLMGTERVIRDVYTTPYADPQPRPPTASEEVVEAFARQPILTKGAGEALAAGTPPALVNRQEGTLEGAVIETPTQALMRALPASVSGAVTELYKRLPFGEGGSPIDITMPGYAREVAKAGASGIDRISPSLVRYASKLGEFPAGFVAGAMDATSDNFRKAAEMSRDLEGGALRTGVGAARAVARGLDRVAGVDQSPLSRELATLQTPLPAFPSAESIPETAYASRVRQGETLEDVIKADPATVAQYEEGFGEAAPVAMKAAGFIMEAPLPFTPMGAALGGAKAVGLTGAVVKGATNALTRQALKTAEKQLAAKAYMDLTQTPINEVPKDLTLDRFFGEAKKAAEVDAKLDPQELVALKSDVDKVVAVARRDLERVKPSTDLVRVSPSYAVPKASAPRVTRAAAADVASLRGQAKARGRALTAAEEAAARDAAVVKAGKEEARRLDELGQYQVLLDGVSTPRVWDSTVVRAVKAALDPNRAMKRAAVTAAEQEVMRKGQDAIGQLRRQVEEGAAEGKSLDQILEGVAAKELAGVPGPEVAKKVIEEAYGPERARTIFPLLKQWYDNKLGDMSLEWDPEDAMAEMIRPDKAREFHEFLLQAGLIPASARVPGLDPNFAANATKIIMEEGVRKRVSKQALEQFKRQYPDIRTPTMAIKGKEATIEEFKFFENGAEDIFKLADTIPTRAIGGNTDVLRVAEGLAASSRNVRNKVRIPLVAEAKLLAGERFTAPIRAYLTTRYALPAGADLVGISTPYGYLTPDDLQAMIDGLGGFGPSRMDTVRRGLMVQDIFLSAAKGVGNVKDLAFGRPMAYAAAAGIEEGYRRGVFVKALQSGKAPEEAITLARRSQLDYGGAQDEAIIQALSPYWAGVVESVAGGTEFLDRFAKNPSAYALYLRALREQQRIQDPQGEQGDYPLARFYAPISDSTSTDVFGRPLDILGPSAPMLQPLEIPIAIGKGISSIDALGGLISDGDLISAALGGSADALDSLAERAATLSAGFGGSGSPPPKGSVERKPTIDQTYLGVLAIARAMDPDRSKGIQDAALRFLQPDVATPPKGKAAYGYEGAKAWASPPPQAKGAYVFASEEAIPGTTEKQVVYYLLQPSKVGRQRIQSLEAIPLSDVVSGPVRAAAGALDRGVGEGVLWLIEAETVEQPTKSLVDQIRQ